MRLRRGGDDELFAADPAARQAAVADLKPKSVDRLRAVDGWPPLSPGAVAAWLVMVTTKPPHWRDPLLAFPEGPLSAGDPHPGWFYPDPIGFWAEVRRWATAVARTRQPSWTASEALTVSAFVHLGDEPQRLALARTVCRPRVLLFLDEPASDAAALDVGAVEQHHIADPHRERQVYQGWWGRLADGTVVGKSPQHPSTHRLYRPSDMDRFLHACPRD